MTSKRRSVQEIEMEMEELRCQVQMLQEQLARYETTQ